MNDQNQKKSLLAPSPFLKKALVLGQFFLIIFVYHLLKDLKDTLVITSSDAGAQVIPFIKIWVILPFAILVSYLFTKSYQKLGREKTLYLFVSFLLASYAFFAFVLYPFRSSLYPSDLSAFLTTILPVGCMGLVSMICYWIYTFFYLAAELWSMMILTVLFWGYLNEITSVKEAKLFYPLCVFTGNCAGIISGQISRFFCQYFLDVFSWQETLQIMISLVIICGMGIMAINRFLFIYYDSPLEKRELKKAKPSVSFRESLQCIFRSTPLLCIAILVAAFGLTSNLVEVVWKGTIKSVYPLPQNYNAYVNQLTSCIGILAVCMSFVSRRIFQLFSWSRVALITPICLFITSGIFFLAMQLPEEQLLSFSTLFATSPLYLIMTLGSLYYVLALTAKYTLFDMCKEMAFLSINPNERMRAKSVIDSVGSRLGKSGASFLYQALLIIFGSTMGSIPLVGTIAVLAIGVSIIATRRLGEHISGKEDLSLSEVKAF